MVARYFAVRKLLHELKRRVVVVRGVCSRGQNNSKDRCRTHYVVTLASSFSPAGSVVQQKRIPDRDRCGIESCRVDRNPRTRTSIDPNVRCHSLSHSFSQQEKTSSFVDLTFSLLHTHITSCTAAKITKKMTSERRHFKKPVRSCIQIIPVFPCSYWQHKTHT